MKGTAIIKAPRDCVEEELRQFASLVRLGFDGSDDTLEARILKAFRLGFYYQDAKLAGIAGLKLPGRVHSRGVFEKSGAEVNHADFELELGWVFVLPAFRGQRTGEFLCRRLLQVTPSAPVFATIRPDNDAMIRTLQALGFSRSGTPYRHREETLSLLLRD